MKIKSILIIVSISILIILILNPLLKFILGTPYPLPLITSESMQHDSNFDEWWEKSNMWYIENGINKTEFETFPLKNGFNKGDMLIAKGVKSDKIKIGDVIVFLDVKGDTISHRVVRFQQNEKLLFTTKGDNYKTNYLPIKNQDFDETELSEEKVVGKVIFRIPYIGYIKIMVVWLLIKLY